VPHADKALKEGKILSGPFAGIQLVSRETASRRSDPRQEDFVVQAQALNREIDALVGARGVAA